VRKQADRWQPLARKLRALRGGFVGIGLVSLIINVLMLTGPMFMLQVYDRVLASGSVPTLVVLGGLTAGLFIFYGILDGLRSRALLRIGQRVDAQLSGEAFEISTLAPLVVGQQSGQVRPVQDIDGLRQFLSGPGPAAIFDLPWMPLYFAVVFLFHPLLGWFAFAGGLLLCLLIALKEAVSRKPAKEAAQEATRRSGFVEMARANAEVIKSMGMLGRLRHQWNKHNHAYLDRQRKSADVANLFSTTTKTVRFLMQSGILGLGAWLAVQQQVSPGIMIAASIMMSRALAPIEQAVAHWSGLVTARQSYGRLKSYISGRAEDADLMELEQPKSSLRVDGLSCAPTGVKVPIVRGVAFNLKAGDGLGIIGPSGSGKSTLARSIIGVVPAMQGSVRFDGSTLDQWDEETSSKFVGYLPQDVQLLDGTIAQNISRFDNEVDDHQVVEAARTADVHDLIASLPQGYNTIIGSAGYALSAGQRQRIALARAIYGCPFLLVLDEPNSNLDAEGESALSNAIKAMREQGSIVIVIAHRPSAIASLDTILCLKDGQQTNFGPKEEVLRQAIAPVPGREAG
jgi:ATP-binding cassette subfamily C protein